MGDEPRIEFPCDYPIKVIGESDPGSIAEVIEIVRKHAPEVTPDNVSTRVSAKGNYHSIRITIVATGEQQLADLHAELMVLNTVKMVL